MKRSGFLGSVLALAFVCQACSSSDSTGTGGGGGSASGGAGGSGTGGAGGAGGAVSDCPAGVTVGITQDGQTHLYQITAVTVGTDGCDVGASDFKDAKIPVDYTVATQTLAVGNPQGKEGDLQPSLGKGRIGCKGTLVRQNQVAAPLPSKCAWNADVSSKFSLIGVDTFTLDVTEKQSDFTTDCTADEAPTGGSCMSTYMLTFKIAGAGGGAGGAGGGAGGAGGH